MSIFDRFRRKPRDRVAGVVCEGVSVMPAGMPRTGLLRRINGSPADLAACLDRDDIGHDALAGIAAWMTANEAAGFLEHVNQEDR